MKIRNLALLLLLSFYGTALANLQPVRSVAVSYGHWQMLESIEYSGSDRSDQTAKKEDESYRTFHLYVQSRSWRGFSVKLDLPYTIVHQTYLSNSRYRTGFTDLVVIPGFRWRFAAVNAGFAFPMGYGNSIDSLWLGSGSVIFRTSLELNGFIRPVKTGVGFETGYKNYLTDSRVGYGSWEAFAKTYLTRSFGRFSLGAQALLVGKSFVFLYRDGNQKKWGEIFNQFNMSLSGFAVYRYRPDITLAAGAGRTALVRDNSPAAFSFWTQIKFKLSKD